MQAGGRLDYADASAEFSITGLPSGVALAGSANGASGVDAALADGRRAGMAAAKALGLKIGPVPEGVDPTEGRVVAESRARHVRRGDELSVGAAGRER